MVERGGVVAGLVLRQTGSPIAAIIREGGQNLFQLRGDEEEWRTCTESVMALATERGVPDDAQELLIGFRLPDETLLARVEGNFRAASPPRDQQLGTWIRIAQKRRKRADVGHGLKNQKLAFQPLDRFDPAPSLPIPISAPQLCRA